MRIFRDIWRRIVEAGLVPRRRLCVIAMGIVCLGFVHAADDNEEDKTELLSKANAELARKFAAVAEWRGFFESSETGSINWTGAYSYGAEAVEISSHGQFRLTRSKYWSGDDVRRGVLTWGGDDNQKIVGEQTVISDRQSSSWMFRGTGGEIRLQASGTLPITAAEFSIGLPSLKKNSSLVTVHSGGGVPGKLLTVTRTGQSVWEESKGNGTSIRRTRSLDEVSQTDSFVRWYSPTATAEIAPWFQVVQSGPGVLVFPYESTGRADTQPSTPELTRGNAASHDPKSRFGDSAPGRGSCFGYICPNDAVPPRTL